MKKILALFFSLMLAICPQAFGQARNTGVAKFAVYSTNNKNTKIVEDAKRLYILDDENNAVLYIDKETGQSGELIEGIAGLYEDVREKISDILVTRDGKLFLITKYNPSPRIVVRLYDGKSFETSKVIIDSEKVSEMFMSPNGKYLGIKEWIGGGHSYYMLVYETENLTMIKKEKVASESNLSYVYSGLRIDNCGTIWPYDFHHFMTLKSTEWELIEYPTKNDEISTFNKPAYFFKDDRAYVAWARRLYSTSSENPKEDIKECAKVPRTENWRFQAFVVQPDGTLFCKNERKYFTYKADDPETPITVGENIDTGIDSPERSFGKRCTVWTPDFFVDYAGNTVFQNGYYDIVIYNPKGIVGYTAGKRKFNKIKETVFK